MGLRHRLVRTAAVVGLLAGVAVLPGARPAAAAGTATGTIDWNDVRQEIDGFGASGSFGQAAAIQKLPEPARTEVLDLLFRTDTGIGLTMVRNLLPNIMRVPGVYDFSGDQDQIWLMQEAKARSTDVRFMSTVWSPPPWMKDNQKVAGGGSVLPAAYPVFADYLAEYVLQYKARFGLDIYAVSPANEPDASTSYDSSRWTGDQLRDFTRSFLAPVWAQKGVPAKYIIPETSYWSEDMALPSLRDPDFAGIPGAAKRVDIVAAHGYGRDNPPAPLAESRAAGKRIWETETSELGIAEDRSMTNGLFWARRVHEFMTGPEVNLFNSWWLATELENVREGLIDVHTLPPNTQPFTYDTTKRLYTIGNFSRFVRPGWVRVGASAGTTPVTAFRNPTTGEFAVIAINSASTASAQDLRLSGFSATSVVPYTTSSTRNLAAGTPISTTGGSIVATLPARSVTTFVGTGAPTTPLSVKVTGGRVWTGEAVDVTATVRNAGATPVTGTLSVGASPLVATPSSSTFTLAPGATTTVPVVLAAPASATAGIAQVTATARVTGSTADAYGIDVVTISKNAVRFTPGTVAEGPWMLAGGSGLDGASARFADGTATILYRFDLPADVTGGVLALDIDNEYDVDTSTDGTTFTDRFTAASGARTQQHLELDLNASRDGGQTLFVRIGDSKPDDGFGGRLRVLDLTVDRSAPPAAVVPEASSVLLPATAGATLAFVLARRRRRAPVAR